MAGQEQANGAGGTTESGAPHGVTLSDHAQISAEIAEADRPAAAILDARKLTDAQWIECTRYWMGRMSDDVRDNGENARIPHRYSDAFAQAQDARKPQPPSDAAWYAKLVVDIQRAGGPAQPLAARGLSTADYLRLSRHWARVLSSDSEAARLFFEAYQALHAPAPA